MSLDRAVQIHSAIQHGTLSVHSAVWTSVFPHIRSKLEGVLCGSLDRRHIRLRHPRPTQITLSRPHRHIIFHSAHVPLALHPHPPRLTPPLYLSSRRPGIVGRPQAPHMHPRSLYYGVVNPGYVRKPGTLDPPVDVVHDGHHARQVFDKMSLSLFSNFISFFRVRRMAGYSMKED